MRLQQSLSRCLRAAACLSAVVFCGSVQGQYVQLADLPTINGNDGTILISGTIVGNDAYAMLSGGGLHRIVKIADVGGANSVSTLTNTSDLNTTLGTVPTGISGTLLASGGNLLILENTTDQVVQIDQMTGAASLLLSNSALDTAIGNTGPSVQFGAVSPVTGNPYFYEADTDAIYEVTAVDTVVSVVDAATLTTVTGDSTPGGLAIDNSGVLYFGQSTDPENVSFLDLSGPTSGTLITEADVLAVQGAGTDIGISSTAFTFVNGNLVFANTGTPDNFVSFDPADPAGTLAIALSEGALLSGPAASAAAIAFSSFNGNLAWFNLSSGGGGVPGIYAVPEPSTLALVVALVVPFALRRRV